MSFSWKENLPQELKEKVTKVEKMIQPRIEEIDEQVLYNQQRVLDLFRKHHVGEEDLVPSTGYVTMISVVTRLKISMQTTSRWMML